MASFSASVSLALQLSDLSLPGLSSTGFPITLIDPAWTKFSMSVIS
jgi:hypothetical protein